MEWKDLQSAWNGDIASVRPLGDFVLVKPFPMEHGSGSLIINPQVQQTRDGRWRHTNRLKGNQMGEVVAVGKGDRLAAMFCKCEGVAYKPGDPPVEIKASPWHFSLSGSLKCDACGEDMISVPEIQHRADMHVKPGDVVVYPQVPSNEFSVNGEKFIFLHEQQHVLAVVEQEQAA